MMRRTRSLLVAVGILSALTLNAYAQEKPPVLPPVVADALKAAYPDAQVASDWMQRDMKYR